MSGNVRIVVLFDGRDEDLPESTPLTTNIEGIAEGLVNNKEDQCVIYNADARHNRKWGSWDRWIAKLIGKEDDWSLKDAFNQIVTQLPDFNNKRVELFFAGYGNGAVLARRFINEYIQSGKLGTELQRSGATVSPQIGGVFLLETVPHSRRSWYRPWLGLFGYRERPIDLSIPPNIHVYQMLALDERRADRIPVLINQGSQTEEIWESGTHLELAVKKDVACYFMCRMMRHGLNFYQDYYDQLFAEQHTVTVPTLATSKLNSRLESRMIYVQVNGAPDFQAPLLSRHVIERMKKEPTYKPPISELATFRVLNSRDSHIEVYDKNLLNNFLTADYITPNPPNGYLPNHYSKKRRKSIQTVPFIQTIPMLPSYGIDTKAYLKPRLSVPI